LAWHFMGVRTGSNGKTSAAFFCRLKLLGLVFSNLRTSFGLKSEPFGVAMNGGVESFGTSLASSY